MRGARFLTAGVGMHSAQGEEARMIYVVTELVVSVWTHVYLNIDTDGQI